VPFIPLIANRRQPAVRFDRPRAVGLRALTLGLLSSLLAASTPFAFATEPATPAVAPPAVFEDDVAPLLKAHCVDCHNEDAAEGGLDLSSPLALLRGSESGPVVTARNRDRSLLFEVIRDGEMPPDGPHLTAAEIQRIGNWIDHGLTFREPTASAVAMADEHEVLPILLLRCTACHGAELKRGDLDLRSVTALLAGGASGAAAIPGDPDASPMITRVESEACPPPGQLLNFFVSRPSTSEIETLRRWIAQGMPRESDRQPGALAPPDPHVTDADRQHWAFRPLPSRVAVPVAADSERLHPVDAFVGQRLNAAGLRFSPLADRPPLIRRVFIGLTGLPPTSEELARWRDSDDDSWYPKLIDELLASPRYGERWGRHWLDIAGYADSEGGQSEDPIREFAWKYRDYVIRSHNEDKPWDRFLLEQLAGDELADYTDAATLTPEIVDNLIATGFLRMGVDETGSRTMNFVPERLGLVYDALNIVGSGILGLSVDCARCHHHKYDPIPQGDYYRLKAIFQGAFDEHDWMSWKTRRLDLETPDEANRRSEHNAPLERQAKSLQQERQTLLKSRRGESGMTEAMLVADFPELAGSLRELDQAIAVARGRMLPAPTVRALWDRGRPSPTYVLIRGEHDRPGRRVDPGVPAVLTDGTMPLDVSPPWPGAASTGRRLAFARWLVGPDHPLTARVLVNRVWNLHMGRGIVPTLDNFGHQGDPPSHPELLDWLARDFIDNGWSLKSLHRRILLSRTFRQTSEVTSQQQELDPDNLLWSRMPVRRVDAEALRDSLLAVTGRLSDTMYGPPAPVTVREDGLVMATPAADGRSRRSVYLRMRRTELPSLLALFDYPAMQPNCIQRTVSTVSLQALILKNNAQIHLWCGDLAGRLLSAPDLPPPAQIDAAYQTLFSRQPTASERDEAVAVLRRLTELHQQNGASAADAPGMALTTLCHTLINSAEFSFLD